MEPLLARIRSCTICANLPLGPRPILQADPRARILIVGQAPGRITHAKGRPFDDPSGDRLRRWLGVDREQFYDPALFALVPMGFCYPGTGRGGDLPPRPECAATWRQPVLDALPAIALTLVLGEYAQSWHLPEQRGESLAKRVGQWRNTWPRLVPMPHPSPRNQRWFRQHPWFEAELVPALSAETTRILAVPARPA
ncbi:MAG: uracil-DNA glycosylase family protein [Beijerinckiaceae bacterium]|nr:uracil-DNA glycosylase family protein [Beijerinckiaceae bacterium]MCZ8299886.1 uracil-DNA glycosylase family protein [Beijerinckiaceae bacterium]